MRYHRVQAHVLQGLHSPRGICVSRASGNAWELRQVFKAIDVERARPRNPRLNDRTLGENVPCKDSPSLPRKRRYDRRDQCKMKSGPLVTPLTLCFQYKCDRCDRCDLKNLYAGRKLTGKWQLCVVHGGLDFLGHVGYTGHYSLEISDLTM